MRIKGARALEGGCKRYELVPWSVIRPGFWPSIRVTCAESSYHQRKLNITAEDKNAHLRDVREFFPVIEHHVGLLHRETPELGSQRYAVKACKASKEIYWRWYEAES